MNLVSILQERAQSDPQGIAIVEGLGSRRQAITFSQLEAASASGAEFLSSQGLRPGQVVLFFCPMGIDLYVSLLAVFRAGLVAMVVDPSAKRDFFNRCCALEPPAAFLGSPRAHWLRLLSGGIRRIPRHFTTRGWVPGAKRWSDWRLVRNLSPTSEIFASAAGDPALITFTSGSTGAPKAAVRTHGFLLEQYRVLASSLDLHAGQRDLATLPIFVLANLAAGVTSVIAQTPLQKLDDVDALAIAQQVKNESVERITASPAFFRSLLEKNPEVLCSVRRIDTGGAPVFPRLLAELCAAAPRAQCSAVYGSTEAEPMAHLAYSQMNECDWEDQRQGRGLLAGKPIAQIELRVIFDQWGKPLGELDEKKFSKMQCGEGIAGEVVVSGPHVLPGYLHGAGEDEIKFRVDDAVWHRTGDAGYLDAFGRLWLLGRCAAKIEDGKGALYPFSVETALSFRMEIERSALLSHRGQRVLFVQWVAGVDSGTKRQIEGELAWAKLDRIESVSAIPLDPRHRAKVDYGALHALAEVLVKSN